MGNYLLKRLVTLGITVAGIGVAVMTNKYSTRTIS